MQVIITAGTGGMGPDHYLTLSAQERCDLEVLPNAHNRRTLHASGYVEISLLSTNSRFTHRSGQRTALLFHHCALVPGHLATMYAELAGMASHSP